MRSREVRSTPRPGTRRSPLGAGFRKSAARCGRPGSDARGAVRIHVTMNRSPSARTAVRLITPFLVAACQPQARRLLLLDLALSDPVVLNSTARPWADAGYSVQYRRFYPHLTRADLLQFRTLVFLLGREPEVASDALTAGDVGLLDEWVRRGGVVVLGYDGDGEGYLDRWTANRWLAYEGAGISIGDRVLEDTTTRVVTTGRAQPWAVARPVGDEPLGSAYDPFPLDRNHVVVTREPTQLLALTSHRAFVRTSRAPAPRPDAGIAAAVRIGEGLVVVISRHALGTLGPQYRPSTTPFLATGPLADTYAFLRAVARCNRRGSPHLPAWTRSRCRPSPIRSSRAPRMSPIGCASRACASCGRPSWQCGKSSVSRGRTPRSTRSSPSSTWAASTCSPATPIPRGPTRCMPAGGSATPSGGPGAMPSAGSAPRASPGSPRSIMGRPGCRPPTPRAAPAEKRCRLRACSTRRYGSGGSLRPPWHSGGSPRSNGPW